MVLYKVIVILVCMEGGRKRKNLSAGSMVPEEGRVDAVSHFIHYTYILHYFLES